MKENTKKDKTPIKDNKTPVKENKTSKNQTPSKQALQKRVLEEKKSNKDEIIRKSKSPAKSDSKEDDRSKPSSTKKRKVDDSMNDSFAGHDASFNDSVSGQY